MITHLFSAVILLSSAAGVAYVLLKLLIWLGGNRLTQRWRYHSALAVMLTFILPLYKLWEIIPFLSTGLVPSAGSTIGEAFPRILNADALINSEALIQIPSGDLGINWNRLVEWSAVIWLLAACGLLLWNAYCLTRFHRQVRQLPSVQNDLLKRLVEKQARSLGVRTNVRLLEYSTVQSPMLTGFFHPAILLSTEHLTIGDAQLILTHELIHLRRGDLWKNSLINLIQAIHWFNPIAYLLKRDFIYWLETSCDEEIAASLDFSQRKKYARLLIDCTGTSRHMSHEFCISFVSCREKLERRISTMLNANKKSNRQVCLILAIVMAIGCISISAFAAEPRSKSAAPLTSNTNNSFAGGTPLDEEEPVGTEKSTVVFSSGDAAVQNAKVPPVFTPAGAKISMSKTAVGSEASTTSIDFDECIVQETTLSQIDESSYEVLDENGNVLAIWTERPAKNTAAPYAGWNINWTVRAGVTTAGDNRYSSYDGLVFDYDIDFSRTGTSWIGIHCVDTNRTYLVMDSTDGFHGTITCRDEYGTIALAIKNASENTITYSGVYYVP